MINRGIRSALAVGIVVILTSLGPTNLSATAETLTMGVAQEPTSVDPHYHGTESNYNLAEHIFDRLVALDVTMQPAAALATSWRKIDDKTWEFDLRQNVKFHDGTPFTADDVAFTFGRAPNVPGSPSSLKGYIGGMKVEVVDPHKIRIITESPDPLVLSKISAVAIVSRKNGGNSTTDDYNAGRATIGTGPFKFVSWRQGSELVLARNDDYWGPKPTWEKVVVKYIGSGPARIAALLSGGVDIIDGVPPADYAKLKTNAKLNVVKAPANRMIYLALDQFRENSPYVSGLKTKTLKNPFLDLRVRQAVSKAIDRDAIVELIMEGVASPAGQLVQPTLFGASPDLKPEAYDPNAAKKLLAQAGYPDGFSVTIQAPNDRFINAAKSAEAIAQMLTAVGIRTTVETMPAGVMASRAATGGPDKTPEFSLHLWGFGGQTGDASSALNFLVHTPERGLGTANRGRYSNKALDALIERAFFTMNDEERRKLLSDATKQAVDDLAVIPVYFLENVYAMRKGLSYRAGIEERMHAFGVTKQ
jgi:peptide/nickel transport system substrate-binding protein